MKMEASARQKSNTASHRWGQQGNLRTPLKTGLATHRDQMLCGDSEPTAALNTLQIRCVSDWPRRNSVTLDVHACSMLTLHYTAGLVHILISFQLF